MVTAKSKTDRVTPSDLIENLAFYPRKDVDTAHVAALADAMRSGAVLPPIVADKATRNILDGFHRRRAHMQLHDHEPIAVEWVQCATEADMYREAVRRNAAHGLRFERDDEIRCTLLGERYGLSVVEIGVLLSKSPETIETLRIRVVVVNGQPEPAKQIAVHLYGTEITEKQAQAMRQAPGVPLMQIVSQLRKIVDAGLFDLGNTRHVEALRGLANLIIERLAPVREAVVLAKGTPTAKVGRASRMSRTGT